MKLSGSIAITSIYQLTDSLREINMSLFNYSFTSFACLFGGPYPVDPSVRNRVTQSSD